MERKKNKILECNSNEMKKRSEKRKEIKQFARDTLISKEKIRGIIKRKEITFSMTGIKEAINQPHKFYDKKNETIYKIVELIKNGEYVNFIKDTKKRSVGFHYLEITICAEPSFIVLKENFNGSVVFYSIVDRLR